MLTMFARGDEAALGLKDFRVSMPAEEVQALLQYDRLEDVGNDLYDVRLGGVAWTCWLSVEGGNLKTLILSSDAGRGSGDFLAAENALRRERGIIPFRLNLNGVITNLLSCGRADGPEGERLYRNFLATLATPGNVGAADYMEQRDFRLALALKSGEGPAIPRDAPVYRLQKENEKQAVIFCVTLSELLRADPDGPTLP